jgi:serine/threonine protein kinase
MEPTRPRQFPSRGDAPTIRRVTVDAESDEQTRARVMAAPPTELRSSGRLAAACEPVVPECGVVLRGRYRLEAPLGQGAMGQVWRARDFLSEEAGEQEALFAIKLFVADFARGPDALRLMHSEARRVQKLGGHPNIVATHIFDRDEMTGLLFMVMELVEGQPLEEMLRQHGTGGLGRRTGVPIVRGIAEGLAFAHAQGIVHCDLKPGNILITGKGVPKILDFGIAQAVQRPEEAGSDGGGTEPLVSGYTRAYASPEALSSQRADPSDDVFALGVVAYEIFGGRHPFGIEAADDALRLGLKPPRLAALRRS